MKNFNIFWFHSFQSRKIFKIRQFLKNPKVQMLTNSYCSRSSRLCQHSLFYQVIQLQHLVFPSGSFTFASSGFSNTTSVFSFPGQELLICHMPSVGSQHCSTPSHRAPTAASSEPGKEHWGNSCHTSATFKSLGLLLFAVNHHTSHFCCTVLFINCLHVDSILTVAPSV